MDFKATCFRAGEAGSGSSREGASPATRPDKAEKSHHVCSLRGRTGCQRVKSGGYTREEVEEREDFAEE